MTLKIHLEDGKLGTSNKALITSRGGIVTEPLDVNLPKFNALTTSPSSFFPPRELSQFLITGLIATRRKGGGSTAAEITIYNANSPTAAATSPNTLLIITVPTTTTLPILDINLLVGEGKWLNAVSDVADTTLTILGFYRKI